MSPYETEGIFNLLRFSSIQYSDPISLISCEYKAPHTRVISNVCVRILFAALKNYLRWKTLTTAHILSAFACLPIFFIAKVYFKTLLLFIAINFASITRKKEISSPFRIHRYFISIFALLRHILSLSQTSTDVYY